MAHGLDDEDEEGGLVHEFGAIMAGVDEQVLQPWPALADGGKDGLWPKGIRKLPAS